MYLVTPYLKHRDLFRDRSGVKFTGPVGPQTENVSSSSSNRDVRVSFGLPRVDVVGVVFASFDFTWPLSLSTCGLM
jgi:hypothetical protein